MLFDGYAGLVNKWLQPLLGVTTGPFEIFSWWGIIFVILMEAALITPPVGLNLYVVQAVRGKGNFMDLCIGALPFVLAMLAMIAILIAFPQLALWLPTILNPKAGG